LEGGKRGWRYDREQHEDYCNLIDKAMEEAESAGSRHQGYDERSKLTKYIQVMQAEFDDRGVPILKGMDGMKVPISGLSIPERLERARSVKEEGLKREAEGASSTAAAHEG
jgi:hypothetical protein